MSAAIQFGPEISRLCSCIAPRLLRRQRLVHITSACTEHRQRSRVSAAAGRRQYNRRPALQPDANSSSNNGAGRVLHLDDDATDPAELIHGRTQDTAQAQLQRFAEENHLFDAVVKVFCIHIEPNYSLPWQRKRQYSSTSSGFMVRGSNGANYLLTNAHSVEYYSQVRVKRREDDEKFLAEVLAIGVECDIALLTVRDPMFWEGAKPVEFGSLPRLQDPVAVVGFPIGGDTLSVSSGVVSRIEVTSYAHGSTELLAIQIDAAINSGNSGGPVFNDYGRCIGIAFQSLSGDAENIGYVIGTPVIQHFLTDFRRNGRFTGFPVLGVLWQRMESAALRAAHGMGLKDKGVLIRKISPTAPAAQALRSGDIITHFDGVQVSNDGTVPFRRGERIAFGFLTSQKYAGEHAIVRLLRDGEAQEHDVELARPQLLVPMHLENKQPSYLVVAGVIFTPCCEPYLVSEYGDHYISEAPTKLLELMVHGSRQTSDEQVVLLATTLADETTLGYEDHANNRVLRFNNAPVRNLRQLAGMVTKCREPYMRFDMEHSEVLILKTSQVEEATQRVLAVHSIPAAASPDLIDVVQGKAAAEASAGPEGTAAAAAAAAAPAG